MILIKVCSLDIAGLCQMSSTEHSHQVRETNRQLWRSLVECRFLKTWIRISGGSLDAGES